MFKRSSALVLSSILLASLVLGQSATPAPAQPAQRKTSTPYTGDLSVFDSPGREQRLHIDRVMDTLGVTAGKNVADIGAGSGWFSVRAAKRVTDSGKVFAVDINPEAAEYIKNRATKEGLHNIETIVSKPDDPQLPASSTDAVLILKTYHEFENPVALMRNLKPALKPGAKLGIIDRNGNGEDHGVNKDVVVREMSEAGYKLLNSYDFVKGDKMDYFLVFTVAQ